MGEAADAVMSSGMHTGQVACRVMYRLAHHADTLYATIQAQKHSPEWNTAQAVIKQKRHQVFPLCMAATLALCMAHSIPSWAASKHVSTTDKLMTFDAAAADLA